VAARTRWSTQVPYSGLSPSGTARLYRIAEWFQESAVIASTEGGYPPQRYEQMGASWFVKELEVVIDQPIRYGAQIAVETWVSDLRRFRSHREYRVLDPEGRVVARGCADWLFLSMDPASRRVKPILPDDEMKSVFPRIDERVIDDQLELAIPDAPPSIEVVRKVRPTELDQHEHVNHTAYVAWIEDLDLPIRRVHLCFEKDARPGDELCVRAWFEGGRGVAEIRRGSERILSAAIA
jgi:acyl-CoA thioesterase FadM